MKNPSWLNNNNKETKLVNKNFPQRNAQDSGILPASKGLTPILGKLPKKEHMAANFMKPVLFCWQN